MFRKKIIFSLLATTLVSACVDGGKYHSKSDADVLVAHSRTVKDSENNPALLLELGPVIKIRKEESGVYYVMSEHFTDEAGYFVLTGDALPGITGKFTQITKTVFSYEIRG